MSRFYNIVVGPATVSPTGFSTPSNNTGAVWTNYIPASNGLPGRADLGAQNVEFDIWNYNLDDPVSLGSVKIWGPTKAQISQASDFNGAPIQVFAGMQPGLPLASICYNSSQQGLILQGQVFQSYGNWQGVNQTLDFVIVPNPGGTQSDPTNISFNWKAGTKLADALQSILTTNFPNFKPPKIDISSALVLSNDEPFTSETLTLFSQYIRNLSKNIVGGDYNGVIISQQGNQFLVFDGSSPTSTTTMQIATRDLIGQVTWLGPAQVQFSTVMRADLHIGDQVTFDLIAGLQAVTTQQSASNVRNKNTFAGSWTIVKIRHVGNSRGPDAQSWVSTFQAIALNASPLTDTTASSSG